MATRSAKGKKAADVKVTENVPAKKGRKGKQATEPETPEMEVDEKTAVPEKKSKRGKKMESEEKQLNGTKEEVGPPAKKSRKKNVEEPTHEEQSNGDNSAAEEEPTPADEVEQDDDQTETNGHTEEPQGSSVGKGRKKQTKKDAAAEKSSGLEIKTRETGRGRKNTKQDSEESDTVKKPDIVEDKSKPGRGRGKKAQAKASNDLEVEEKVEDPDEAKPEPSATKGRKKQTKANKEKTPDVDKEVSENQEQKEEEVEDKVEEEPKKKETKSRKNQGKKVSPKEDPEEKDEEIKEESQPAKKRKGAKKEEKSKGDSKDEEEEETELEEKAPEAKPTKGKRGQKNAPTKPIETEEEVQDTGELTNKRRRKPAEEKAADDEGKKKAPLKNKCSTNYEEIDFSNAAKTTQGKEWNFKIASWNVDGIRAWLGKGGLDYLKYEKPDILCLQEIKCAKEKLPQEVTNVPGYHAYWLCSDQDGYAGVGIYTTKLAMNVQYGLQNEELDSEGRIITAEYEQFYLVCTYVPNAGRKLITLPKRLKWNEEFRKYVKSLDMKKPVIICGDMNVSHNEIDLANPKTNKKNAGFTEEERAGMTELLNEGFVDTYRQLYPQKANAYTFWTYMMNSRAKNVGWRLDYFIMSQRLLPSLCDSVIRNEVYGSDHCPIAIFLRLSSADKPKE
ncbi:unnamed protein product [Parnassius mnemosyne]|uniref:DNA-(apurinic or apyrimidinic site) endonuclease n=1 Tax=Parnassius mnemosyne TaxID=213953 RepID=A0AAV1K6T0_9NEOP